MSLQSSFRRVLITEIVVRNESKKADLDLPLFSFEDIKNRIQNRVNSRNTTYPYANETKKIGIEKTDFKDNKYLCLLIKLGDKNIPNPVFENFLTEERRDITKKENEGNLVSAHIVIKSDRNKERDSHIMLIEQVPGLSISMLQLYFRYLFNDELYHKSHEGNTYRCLFDIIGYKGTTIENALEDGELKDIEFIHHESQFIGFDEANTIKKIKTKITITLNDVNAKNSMFNKLISHYKKHPTDRMFVKIKSNDQTQTSEVDIENPDILSQYLIKNEVIKGFSKPLPQAYKNINTEVISKIINLFPTERK